MESWGDARDLRSEARPLALCQGKIVALINIAVCRKPVFGFKLYLRV